MLNAFIAQLAQKGISSETFPEVSNLETQFANNLRILIRNRQHIAVDNARRNQANVLSRVEQILTMRLEIDTASQARAHQEAKQEANKLIAGLDREFIPDSKAKSNRQQSLHNGNNGDSANNFSRNMNTPAPATPPGVNGVALGRNNNAPTPATRTNTSNNRPRTPTPATSRGVNGGALGRHNTAQTPPEPPRTFNPGNNHPRRTPATSRRVQRVALGREHNAQTPATRTNTSNNRPRTPTPATSRAAAQTPPPPLRTNPGNNSRRMNTTTPAVNRVGRENVFTPAPRDVHVLKPNLTLRNDSMPPERRPTISTNRRTQKDETTEECWYQPFKNAWMKVTVIAIVDKARGIYTIRFKDGSTHIARRAQLHKVEDVFKFEPSRRSVRRAVRLWLVAIAMLCALITGYYSLYDRRVRPVHERAGPLVVYKPPSSRIYTHEVPPLVLYVPPARADHPWDITEIQPMSDYLDRTLMSMQQALQTSTKLEPVMIKPKPGMVYALMTTGSENVRQRARKTLRALLRARRAQMASQVRRARLVTGAAMLVPSGIVLYLVQMFVRLSFARYRQRRALMATVLSPKSPKTSAAPRALLPGRAKSPVTRARSAEKK